MQAIVTNYHGPTNARGSRVTATAQAGRLTIPWDHSKNRDDNHRAAALALARRLHWRGTWATGTLPDGRDCHVSIDRARDDGPNVSTASTWTA